MTDHPIKREFDEAYGLVGAKAHDYAEDDNPFSNFEFAAEIAGITVEQVFMVMIAIKTARLGQLIGKGKEPNNESIDDTLLDAMNYPGLLKAYRRQGSEEVYDEAMSEDAVWDVLYGGDFTFNVGNIIGLMGDTSLNPLRYVITGFDAADNKVLALPTRQFQGLLGDDTRRLSPDNIHHA